MRKRGEQFQLQGSPTGDMRKYLVVQAKIPADQGRWILILNPIANQPPDTHDPTGYILPNHF